MDAVEIVRALGCDKGFSDFAAVRAWRSDGSQIDVDEWHRLAQSLKARRTASEWQREEWQLHATLMLPAGAYVDSQAWRAAYERCPDGPGPLVATLEGPDADVEDRDDAAVRVLDYDYGVPASVAGLVVEGFGIPDGGDEHEPGEPIASVAPVSAVGVVANMPRVPLMEQNRLRVLDALRLAGFDPIALPPFKKGKKCPAKSAAKTGADLSDASFSHAWRDLSESGRVCRRH